MKIFLAAMLARLRQSRLVCSDETGAQHQVCLARQLWNCEYAIERGDRQFAPCMKRLLLRAIALGRHWGRISARTFAKHRRRLEDIWKYGESVKSSGQSPQHQPNHGNVNEGF